MAISKNFEFQEVDSKWYNYYINKELFHSTPDSRPPYTIVIPPPNVTGILHMGHALNETVQDILARRARMSGYNVCWVPGSDHASIATEAKVVHMLKTEKGIDKSDLTREEFLRYAFEWKDTYGGIIMDQIKKLGCSCDWDRLTFTMDDHYYKAVIKIFVQLYNEGLIYRGARMINWDPQAKTALSDEEVEFRDEKGKLYYIKYFISDADGKPTSEYLEVATKRPETIMGDTAVCVNPADQRYQKYIGQRVIVPMTDRTVPIISDDYVDIEFGTGILKITPAHDINDYELGLKHNLDIIDTLNEDGTISEVANLFVGEDRFQARKLAIAKLEEEGNLIKIEEYDSRIGYSQRTGVVVEPRISTQWFLRMRELSHTALQAVQNGEINIYPKDRFIATYTNWLTDTKDWCISRQLWWGQRIPAFYDADGKLYVAENEEEAVKIAQEKNPSITELNQDPDCLDTWFSSWIWPIEVFHGITQTEENTDINYYYPTSVLVTGQDIIFFWVARMVMAGYHFRGVKPFDDVYFTGIVRDSQGRKMSKSLGNSPDLLALIDQYGADAVRFGIMICAPAGNDLLFSEDYIEQGRNFVNKIWNAFKLIELWKEKEATEMEYPKEDWDQKYFHIQWMKSRIAETQVELDKLYSEYKISQALRLIYSLIWDDFCSWYLEWAKPEYQSESIDNFVLKNTISMFDELLHMLHPFMPFVTDEIYSLIENRAEGDVLMTKLKSENSPIMADRVQQGSLLKEVITNIRNIRTKNQLKQKDEIQLFIDTNQKDLYNLISELLSKQVKATSIEFTQEVPDNSQTVVIGTDKLYVTSEHLKSNSAEDIAKLQSELEYHQGFLISVEKKLNNEKFVQNAKPEIVDAERKKQKDSQDRIEAIKSALGLN